MFTGAEGEDIAFFLTSFPDRFQAVLERRRNKTLQEGKHELLKTIINLKKSYFYPESHQLIGKSTLPEL